MKNIFDRLEETGNFVKLVGLIRYCGLEELLTGEEQYTIFAPDDDAFMKVPEDYIESTFRNKEVVAEILKYHIVVGDYTINDLLDFDEIQTLQGSNLKITREDSKIFVNSAEVVRPDIETENGIIQMIDLVLAPSE